MMKSKFLYNYRCIMEDINKEIISYSKLFNNFYNHTDKEKLNQWVNAIDEAEIIDHPFDIDEMRNFDKTLPQDQLDKIIEIGQEILKN